MRDGMVEPRGNRPRDQNSERIVKLMQEESLR
jgi:hypothetical protein